MKNLLIVGIILGLPLCAQAQNTPKNEFSLGYFSVGEFFDGTPIKLSQFNRGKNISLKYTRLIGKKYSLAATYARSLFVYDQRLVLSGNPEQSRIGYRYQQTFTADGGIGFSKRSFLIRIKGGIRYNMVSEKYEYYPFSESIFLNCIILDSLEHYAKLGLSTGISIAHPIYGPIFGEFDSEFAKMFSGADQNQLLLSYRIGIRF